MLRKTISYTDYNGNERTENFYFYLNKAELMDMELGTVGGMRELIKLLIEKQDIPRIISTLKSLIMKAYGEKSSDGRRFIKSKELSDAFSQTEAYAKLYTELLTNAEAAAAFINGIVPEDVALTAEATRKEREAAMQNEESKPVNAESNKVVNIEQNVQSANLLNS